MGLEVLSVGRLLEEHREGKVPRDAILVGIASGPEQGTPSHLAHVTTSLPAKALGNVTAFRLDAPVYTLSKTPRNPFGDMITVGRAANNDIILTDPGVSKFHAYFRPAGSSLRIYDSGSTNGTRLDGRILDKAGAELSTSARIEFGPSCTLVYVAAADLAEWLNSVSGAMGRLSPQLPVRLPTPPQGAETMRVPRIIREAGVAGTRKEAIGSLASERLSVLLVRLEKEGFAGIVEVQLDGGAPRLELGISASGHLVSFTAGGRPAGQSDLVRALGARSGVFRLRHDLTPPSGGVGSPLGRIGDVLASI